jgi:diguanylate cyclase (GGDEF)-like protein
LSWTATEVRSELRSLDFGACGPITKALSTLSLAPMNPAQQGLPKRVVVEQHDVLTDLPNLKGFFARLLMLGVGDDGAMLLGDLDRFRLLNQHMGHHAGDEVLGVVTEVLRGICPDGGLLARASGNAFAVCVRQASQAPSVAEAMRDAVELHLEPARELVMADMRANGLAPTAGPLLTLSVGWAFGPQPAYGGRVHKATTTALLRAKGAGGNCVRGPSS